MAMITPHCTYFAAIGTDGLRPIVWGLGTTADGAREDAASECDLACGTGWDSDGSTTVEITPAMAARIEAGIIDPGLLGIAVLVDRDGKIVGAEVRS